MNLLGRLLLPALFLLIAACDRLGIPDPAKQAAIKEAEGKAIGGACRHAGRALEDCYAMYSNAQKASVFAGWREMNDYMLENKIEVVRPEFVAPADSAGSKRQSPQLPDLADTQNPATGDKEDSPKEPESSSAPSADDKANGAKDTDSATSSPAAASTEEDKTTTTSKRKRRRPKLSEE